MRNHLLTRHHRLLRLKETVRKRKIKLSEEQIQALERFDPEYRERNIQVNATVELVAVDTFLPGTLKGVGKVYIQTVLERFHRTLLEEHLRIKGRTTWYETLEEMQKELGGYLETYNTRRPHRGRGMEGRSPNEVFKAGTPRKRRTQKPSATTKKVKTAA